MTLAQIIPLALQISIALIVFSVALKGKPGDLTYLLGRPGLLIRSLLAMNLVMPLLAVLIAALFHLHPALEAALILLAVSPVPPILPGKQSQAGGDLSYGIGLLTVSALISIVLAPATVTLIGRAFGVAIQVPMQAIAITVAKSVLVPLIVGVVVRRMAPAFAERVAGLLSRVGTVVLVLGLIPILITMWPEIAATVGNGALVAIALFVLVSLLVGHLLGGPKPEDRTVLALSTACRHPGVAMALVSAIAAGDKNVIAAVSGAVFLCVLVGAVVTVPYVRWRKRSAMAGATAAPASGGSSRRA